ncbi:hypothetical protein CEXT_5931 [Caerostris extrusa]|uniref:Uncharacterized protein n=1 Tax=Caerostris extrusa TaxID=172846 RepID=A0AAV4Y8W2_CAEEX|nr:hypothetical protein CEXT_5931 [Caerostris extrusa]
MKFTESSTTSFRKPTYYQSTQNDIQVTKKEQLHYSTTITAVPAVPEYVTGASNVPLLSMVNERLSNISANYLSTTTATVETHQTKQFSDAKMNMHATREQYKPLYAQSTVKSSNPPVNNNFEYPIFYRAKNIHYAPVQQNIPTTSQEILKNTNNYPSTFTSSFYYPTIVSKDINKKREIIF